MIFWIKLWTFFFQNFFVWLDFPCFKIVLSQMWFFESWIEAMSKGLLWIILRTCFSETFVWLDFPCFKIVLSQILIFRKLDWGHEWRIVLDHSANIFSKTFFVDWIFLSSKLDYPNIWLFDYLKFDFSKIGLRPRVKELFGSFCEHFFKNVSFGLDFLFFIIGLSQIWFSKIGLKPWLNDLFGSFCEHFFSKKKILCDWIFLSSKLDYLKFDFSKIGLRPWIKDVFSSFCEHCFQKTFLVDWILLSSKLDYLKFDISKIGLRPWVKDLFGSFCEHFCPKTFVVDWVFLFFLKKWIISNLIFKIGLRPWIKKLFGSSREHLFFQKKLFYWICVSSKFGFLKCFFRKLDWGHEKNMFSIILRTFYNKNAACWLDFPFFKIRLSHIWFSKIGLKLCVKDFLGSSCELFSITAFWLDFSFLKIRLSQNWFFPKLDCGHE